MVLSRLIIYKVEETIIVSEANPFEDINEVDDQDQSNLQINETFPENIVTLTSDDVERYKSILDMPNT